MILDNRPTADLKCSGHFVVNCGEEVASVEMASMVVNDWPLCGQLWLRDNGLVYDWPFEDG